MLRASFHSVQQIHTRYESSSTDSFHHHSLASSTTYFRVRPDAVVRLNNQCLSPFSHASVGRSTSPSIALEVPADRHYPRSRYHSALDLLVGFAWPRHRQRGPCEQQFRWCDGGYSSLRSATERGDESGSPKF